MSTGRSRVYPAQAKEEVLMLVCFFAYSYTIHSVDQAIQLLTPGCHSYLL